mgnify:CR=1 FL=1
MSLHLEIPSNLFIIMFLHNKFVGDLLEILTSQKFILQVIMKLLVCYLFVLDNFPSFAHIHSLVDSLHFPDISYFFFSAIQIMLFKSIRSKSNLGLLRSKIDSLTIIKLKYLNDWLINAKLKYSLPKGLNTV